jgi:hypothetical protein
MDLSNATEQELEAELRTRKSEDFYVLLDTFHAYMCSENHGTICTFYMEKQLINCNEQPARRNWAQILQNDYLDRDWTISELREGFCLCSPLLGKYYRLTPKQRGLFDKMIEANR